MRDLDRDPRLAADAYRFADRVEKPFFLVAHMGHIDPAVFRSDLRERDQFLGRSGETGVVLEARRQPERAFFHRHIHYQKHLGQLFGRSLSPVIAVHNLFAQTGVADERADVRADLAVQLREVIRDRIRRAAVGSDKDRRDALRDLVRCGAFFNESVLRMIVDIDESRREDLAAGVDHGLVLLLLERADLDDLSVLHPDARGKGGRARAIDHRGVDDQERLRGNDRSAECERKKKPCEFLYLDHGAMICDIPVTVQMQNPARSKGGRSRERSPVGFAIFDLLFALCTLH